MPPPLLPCPALPTGPATHLDRRFLPTRGDVQHHRQRLLVVMLEIHAPNGVALDNGQGLRVGGGEARGQGEWGPLPGRGGEGMARHAASHPLRVRQRLLHSGGQGPTPTHLRLIHLKQRLLHARLVPCRLGCHVPVLAALDLGGQRAWSRRACGAAGVEAHGRRTQVCRPGLRCHRTICANCIQLSSSKDFVTAICK